MKTSTSEQKRRYKMEHKEKTSRDNRKYYQTHKEEIQAYRQKRKTERNKQVKDRRAMDVQFYLRDKLRIRLRSALKGQYKNGSAVRDLGCTIPELVKHLESQFTNGMTWENKGQWHVDHIRPLSSFDLTDKTQLLEACNWKNLQPLWAKDNISKGNKMP